MSVREVHDLPDDRHIGSDGWPDARLGIFWL